MKLKVTVDGTAYEVEVEVAEENTPTLGPIVMGGAGPTPAAPTSASVKASTKNAVVAPLAGSVAKVLVAEGDEIDEGSVLITLEAMKMETEITAPRSGKITAIHVEPGEAVQGGEALLELE